MGAWADRAQFTFNIVYWILILTILIIVLYQLTSTKNQLTGHKDNSNDNIKSSYDDHPRVKNILNN